MHDISIDLREPTLAHMRNRLYDLKAPEPIRAMIAMALDGLERNPGEGEIIVRVSGRLVETTLIARDHGPESTLAFLVDRLPPPPAMPVQPAYEDALESTAEQPAEQPAADAPGPTEPPPPVARRRRAQAAPAAG